MGGARGPWVPPPHLFLVQTEARRAEKKFLWDRAPPYLKVWIRHCSVLLRLLGLKLQLCLKTSFDTSLFVMDRNNIIEGKTYP